MEKNHRERTLLQEIAQGVLDGWPEEDVRRLAVKGVARDVAGCGTRAERRRRLAAEPILTGTRADALLGAVGEHVASLYGLPAPAWTNRPERFLDEPHAPAYGPHGRRQRLDGCPAAFIRRGFFVDPQSLDERGGESCQWVAEDETWKRT